MSCTLAVVCKVSPSVKVNLVLMESGLSSSSTIAAPPSENEVAEAIIAKNRHGPISKVRLHFNPTITKFSDLAETSF